MTETPNTIVAEIHSSFAVAEEELLKEAKALLKDAEDEGKKERADKLARMGFANSKPVRRLSKEERKKATNLMFLKQRYDRIAPQYKFITEEKLFSICEKYGLVVGGSERYTEDIPEANQEDISNFKILDKSFLEVSDDSYRDAVHKTRGGDRMHPKEMATSHIENLLDVMFRKFSVDQTGMYMSQNAVGDINVTLIRAMVTELALRGEEEAIKSHRARWINGTVFSKKDIEKLFTPLKTTYFYVAADIDSFELTGADLKGNKIVDNNNDSEIEESMKADLFRHYDPIVLAKVEGGYLIVTAWGNEASDPDVVNPTRN